jgi:hypothetical protein
LVTPGGKAKKLGTYLNGLLPKSFAQKITKNTKTDSLNRRKRKATEVAELGVGENLMWGYPPFSFVSSSSKRSVFVFFVIFC